MSPLQSDREIARALNDAAKLPFVEVYVATSLSARSATPRDATRGHARALTRPTSRRKTRIVLDTAGANIDDLVAQVIAVLNERSPRN